MLHGTGIFTYIWLQLMPNVGKYASPMEPLEDNDWTAASGGK